MAGMIIMIGILITIVSGLAFILSIDNWGKITIFGKMLCILLGLVGFPVVFFWLINSPIEYLCNYIGRVGKKLIIKG